mmetsp:Transcript_3407/g.3843  ORF Transcript_3407/g.3843 Transcript_3407/m.3843 type:complete len:148 (-) Transcript_3407:204-647(-)|eukprot:CAMPEP_0170782678 /NCGR_PEP_ID=MMETSP0733-20121128/15031_1 /TAXON_ID=186038 /ORGANISM="Fragilariopsis kerguelensis, Strain L26-C5" /LENGTH=147 /DNA_ID=CAMNT_0011127141 /DNA_START=114 /DNA_END=557 /DNA_ORIENTATION=-
MTELDVTRHPAYEIFLEWRKLEQEKESVQEHGIMILLIAFDGKPIKKMSKNEIKLCNHIDSYKCDKYWNGKHKVGFEEELLNLLSHESRNTVRRQKMKELKKKYLKLMEDFKKMGYKQKMKELEKEYRKEKEDYRKGLQKKRSIQSN